MGLILRRHNAHRFIHTPAYRKDFLQKGIRVLFRNEAKFLISKRNGSKENRRHFPNLSFHFGGAFHAVQMLHMVNGAMVGFPKKITAAAGKTLSADIAVFLFDAFMAVALFLMPLSVVHPYIMEMAEGPPFIGVNILLIFHDILLVIHIPGHFRIMGMVMMKRLLLMVMVVMAAAAMMVVLLIVTSRIIFMHMTLFMMMVMAVAAAAVVGVHRFFFRMHIHSSL